MTTKRRKKARTLAAIDRLLAENAALRARHEKLRQAVRDGFGCDHRKPWQECPCENCALLRDDRLLEKQP